ncbi:SRPBCC family protein, partial [Streptomyces sp. Act-28]
RGGTGRAAAAPLPVRPVRRGGPVRRSRGRHRQRHRPEPTEVLPEFADGYAAQYYVGHGAEFGEGVRGFTVDGSEGLDRVPGVAEEQDRRYCAITVKPQVFVNLVPDHVVFHRMHPVAVDRTVVECDWLYLPHVVESGKDVDRSVELFHRVNQQDFEACERTQPAMSSKAYAGGGALVPSEHHIGTFPTGMSERLGAPQGRFSPGSPSGG